MKKVDIVLGTLFGDEGKGIAVANLCRDDSLVVRFSGGQNAGHTVIQDGIKHTFSSYGSGTLRGCPTYFTEDTCISLLHINKELEILKEKGITPKLYVHPLAKMTTCFDIMSNWSEAAGKNKSCGTGIGATMTRHNHGQYQLYAVDFLNRDIFKQKVDAISEYYKNYSLNEIVDDYYQLINDMEIPFEIATPNIINKYNHVVFEGSQGILLDKDHGIFPDVTYANTTSKNVWKYINQTDAIDVFYCMRTYLTRHGRGWLPPYHGDKVNLRNDEEEINVTNQWQGDFRIQPIDYSLVDQALEYDKLYHPTSIDYDIAKHIIVGCVDQTPNFDFSEIHKRYGSYWLWKNISPRVGNFRVVSSGNPK